jgi:hypothetical protein
VAQLQQAKAFVTDLALWKRRGVGRGGDDDLVMCGAVADIHVDWAQWRSVQGLFITYSPAMADGFTETTLPELAAVGISWWVGALLVVAR